MDEICIFLFIGFLAVTMYTLKAAFAFVLNKFQKNLCSLVDVNFATYFNASHIVCDVFQKPKCIERKPKSLTISVLPIDNKFLPDV
jgi:hypothetical protein